MVFEGWEGKGKFLNFLEEILMNVVIKQKSKPIRRVQSLVVLIVFGLGVVLAKADAYGPIEVLAEVGDLKVKHAANVLQDRVTLNVKNLEDEDLQCTAAFSDGPELIIKRVGFVTAGREIFFTAPLRRNIMKLVVDLSCQKLE